MFIIAAQKNFDHQLSWSANLTLLIIQDSIIIPILIVAFQFFYLKFLAWDGIRMKKKPHSLLYALVDSNIQEVIVIIIHFDILIQ